MNRYLHMKKENKDVFRTAGYTQFSNYFRDDISSSPKTKWIFLNLAHSLFSCFSFHNSFVLCERNVTFWCSAMYFPVYFSLYFFCSPFFSCSFTGNDEKSGRRPIKIGTKGTTLCKRINAWNLLGTFFCLICVAMEGAHSYFILLIFILGYGCI